MFHLYQYFYTVGIKLVLRLKKNKKNKTLHVSVNVSDPQTPERFDWNYFVWRMKTSVRQFVV